MDKIISNIAALGVPSLILIIAIEATGLTGAAAITTALASLGPMGMVSGVGVLIISCLISKAVSEYGCDAIFRGVVRQLCKQGETPATIAKKIEKYPVSQTLKLKLLHQLECQPS